MSENINVVPLRLPNQDDPAAQLLTLIPGRLEPRPSSPPVAATSRAVAPCAIIPGAVACRTSRCQ